MGVRRLPSGAWQARIQVQGRRLTGTFATRDEAEEWEVLTHAQALRGKLSSRTTVAQYAERWLEGYASAQANTRKFHRVHLHQWIVPVWGSQAAASITPTDVTTLLNRRIQAIHDHRGCGSGPGSVTTCHATVASRASRCAATRGLPQPREPEGLSRTGVRSLI